MASVKLDGHSFSKEYVASFKTEGAFLKEADTEGHKVGWFEGDKNRKAKLKEVYALASGKVIDEPQEQTDNEVGAG